MPLVVLLAVPLVVPVLLVMPDVPLPLVELVAQGWFALEPFRFDPLEVDCATTAGDTRTPSASAAAEIRALVERAYIPYLSTPPISVSPAGGGRVGGGVRGTITAEPAPTRRTSSREHLNAHRVCPINVMS